ncbi:MAG: hypothetical protein RL758_1245 [Pseudomonadota bacterium]|jgi:CheY-like chemotaxis protein/class 3 adenylate cyclase
MASILVVEDDPSTQLVIVANLEKDGHRVVAFSDGVQALTRIEHVQPDVLITDIQVPGMDGYALVERLRGDPRWASLPIIMLTALSQRVNYRVGMTAGADDYLTKPFSLAELRQAVHAQLKRVQRLQEVQRETVQTIVEQEKEKIAAQFEKRLHKMVKTVPVGAELDKLREGLPATVLCTGMRGYLRYAEVLNPEQMGNFMQRYYEGMYDAMQLFGARAVQFRAGSVLGVFPADEEALTMTKEVKLWRAATAVRQANNRLKTSFDRRFSRMGLPLFETAVALHAGLVQVISVGSVDDGDKQIVPIGDTINSAWEIFDKMLHRWDITASVDVVHGLRSVATVADRHVVHASPRLGTLDVCEMEELSTQLEDA